MNKLALPVVVLFLLAVACAPPRPSASFEPCQQSGPFQCVLWYTADQGTTATGEATTTEPATFISIELTLEQKRPDGTFTGIWVDRSGLGSRTQHREFRSALIDCQPGYYRWHMRVQFVGNRTTYYTTSSPFYVR